MFGKSVGKPYDEEISRIQAPTLVLKPKEWYDYYVCHITEDDINMMSVMDWIGLDSERFGLIQLDWIE